MINNNHQNSQSVFSRQSCTIIVQNLPTSGLAQSARRTNGLSPARQTRVIPLDVEIDISRDSARLPAAPAGERPRHPTHTDPGLIPGTGARTDTIRMQTRLSQPNAGRDPHRRRVVGPVQFDFTKNSASRTNIQRPDTGTNSRASRSPGRGEHVDPNNSRRCVTHGQRPPWGVSKIKAFVAKALSASQEPAPLTKGGRARVVNKDSPRSQNPSRAHSLSNARVKLVHTTLWLHPLVRAELERIAQCERLPLSQIGAIGLDQWVRTRLHDQHEALLYPVLRQLIRDELHAFGNRLVFFLMRIAFAAEQTRMLVTNILNRLLKHQGAPDEAFNNLVDKSNRMAKRNIIARTPEMKSLMQEWFSNEPEEKPDYQQKTGQKGENR